MVTTRFLSALSMRSWLYIAVIGVASTQYVPDSQRLTMDELERLLVDTGGINDGVFKSGITPCSNYVDSSTGLNNNTLGRQTASQWIRTAFHDFGIPNIAAGDGGLDASIGFETLLPENVGVAMNDSLFFFSFFVNDRASMADLIALGTVIAVGACGGPAVPLRGGRIDATKAGPYTVCEPQTDIKTTLSRFAAAGFDRSDTISLTICGHAMGGVHHESFPDVVPETAVSVNNLSGREPFGGTPDVFDAEEIREYLTGTGERGGPLVTNSNVTDRSDLRLFLSDNNATAKKISRSPETFASTCASVLARMIDTVPKGVSLTPRIEPQHVRLMNITLDIDWHGYMKLGGYVRYLQQNGDKPAPESVVVSTIKRSGRLSRNKYRAVSKPTEDAGTSIFGPTRFYPFNISFPASQGLSGVSAFGQKLPLQDSLFVVFALSSNTRSFSDLTFETFINASEWTFNITTALLTTSPPKSLSGTFAIPVPQAGTVSPRMDHSQKVTLSPIGKSGPYTLYSVIAKLNINGNQLFGTTIDVEAKESGAKAAFFKLYSLFKVPRRDA